MVRSRTLVKKKKTEECPRKDGEVIRRRVSE